MTRKALPDLGIVVSLLLLPLLLFAPVALGTKTVLPADTLFLFEPFRAVADDLGVTFPQNHLVADLILENYAWKRFLVEALHRRELPLWDPYIFAGHPFLANGQHSALYPLSLVFYLLPLSRAFGVFVWLQLGLAGIFSYLLARVLGISRLGGLVAGITFQFSAFMVVSVVHPMIIAGASWLPFILAMVELVIRQRPAFGRSPATVPWMLLGAAGLGCQMLAGHAENTYFVLLVTVAYAVWRLVSLGTGRGDNGHRWMDWVAACQRAVLGLIAMLGLGLGLGAVQFVPLYEVVSNSFRGGEAAASLQQVLEWAYPWRRLITFAVPNFFGNPAHHGYVDIFSLRWTPAPTFPDGQYITWGIKNYVEGGAYLGLLPLILAALAVLDWLAPRVSGLLSRAMRSSRSAAAPGGAGNTVPFFALLALFSLGCVFGTPLYALVYALPFLKQSHSPFRWVFPMTAAVAVLAGLGFDVVRRAWSDQAGRVEARLVPKRTHGVLRAAVGRLVLLNSSLSPVSVLAGLAFWGGVGTLAGLGLSRLLFEGIEPWVERLYQSLALAPTAFPDHRAFYSYEFKWIALFGLLLTATGVVLCASRWRLSLRRRPVWELLAVSLLLVDFVTFGAGTNPAVDQALLRYVPPVVEFLRQDTTLWRYATFTPPGTTKTMNANVGMFYGLQCVAGYDSLFSREYADYMGLIEPQDERQYNRIASFREWSSLDSPLTDLLNVKYIVTEVEIPNPARFRLVYQDQAVRVYENLGAMPRAFTLPFDAAMESDDVRSVVQDHDLRAYVVLEPGAYPLAVHTPQARTATAQRVSRYTHNEVEVDVRVMEPSWLVVGDAYYPGWRAYVRPLATTMDAEQEATVYRVNGILRGVPLDAGEWTVRFKYSPDSVKIGAFVSFLAGMVLLFLLGIYLWRFFYREEDDASTVRRVAKNSIAPIVINLFTRSIEMVSAALMARILGAVGNGRYATAISIYLWFDIIANFGLDMYLMREVARDRACGRRVFANTMTLRVLLFVGTAGLMAAFLAGRQALAEPLAAETVWAVVLLYVGLLPFSMANGLAALFRGCEKHEIPAAIQTVTTIVKVTLQVLVLVGGMGIVGLAATSIVTNIVTLVVLAVWARRIIWPSLPIAEGEGLARAGWMNRWVQRTTLAESWPLMASLLLQQLFPGVNVLMLQGLQGDAAVGWYDAARKWVDAPSIVPSFFTFAVFPVMSRQAAEDRSGLRRSYSLSVKLLMMLTLPVALCITLLARPLVGLLSGQQFLPQGAEILRLLIWSIVFGWINSLTNYVLIALHRQRFVLLASGARVGFTIAANFVFVRSFSYVASAWIIIAGELLLAILFLADLRRQIGTIGLPEAVVRPLGAGLAMAAVAWSLSGVSVLLALPVALAIYVAALVILRALSPEEWRLLSPLLPVRLRRFASG